MTDTANAGAAGADGAKPDETGGAGTDAPNMETLLAEIETLKGHSRKWEDRAKENFEAKKALDEIRTAQMSDEERHAAAEEERTAALKAAQERAEAAEVAVRRYQIAADFGLSAEDAQALSSVTDEDALKVLAERLSGRSATPVPGTRPNPAQGNRGRDSAPLSAADAFADAVGVLF